MLISWLWMSVGALAVLWTLAEAKTSRADGTYLRVGPFRRMLLFLMPTRTESCVLFDASVRADALLEYVARAKQRFPCDITHCLVGACAVALAENPKMNRFAVNGRLYQRKGNWVTFSMKRKHLDREAALSAVKLATGDESFEQLCHRMEGHVGLERSGQPTYTDKELGLFARVPGAVMRLGLRVARWLDRHNLLPHDFIANDPLFTSIFVANLGSLGMGAGYHHLFEWGTCHLFLMVGQVEERAVVEGGRVVVRKVLPLRFTYDERVDDGLNARFGIEAVRRVLEDPFGELGCVDAPAVP